MIRHTRARVVVAPNYDRPGLGLRAIDGAHLVLDGFVAGEEVVIVPAKEWEAGRARHAYDGMSAVCIGPARGCPGCANGGRP